jgi:hypothetical protein
MADSYLCNKCLGGQAQDGGQHEVLAANAYQVGHAQGGNQPTAETHQTAGIETSRGHVDWYLAD